MHSCTFEILGKIDISYSVTDPITKEPVLRNHTFVATWVVLLPFYHQNVLFDDKRQMWYFMNWYCLKVPFY